MAGPWPLSVCAGKVDLRIVKSCCGFARVSQVSRPYVSRRSTTAPAIPFRADGLAPLARGRAGQREWLDLARCSPSLPLAGWVAAEDAHFCTHHGSLGAVCARTDRLTRRRTALHSAGAFPHHHPAGGQKPVPLGRGGFRRPHALEFPLAAWVDFVLPKPRILRFLPSHRRARPAGQFGVESGQRYSSAHRRQTSPPREAATFGLDPCESVTRSARAPGPGVGGWPDLLPGAGLCSSLFDLLAGNRGF